MSKVMEKTYNNDSYIKQKVIYNKSSSVEAD